MLASNAGLVDVMFQIARTKVWIRVKLSQSEMKNGPRDSSCACDMYWRVLGFSMI